MNSFINGVARAIAETFELPGPVLEVGSYQVDGQEEIAELRQLFTARPYVGIDVRPGLGVDAVADVEKLPYPDGSFGTVIALNTFEHVPRFWRGFEEVSRVLKPDGAFLFSSPFYFHIHNYPNDYWRFTPEALDVLLHDYPNRILGWHGPSKRPAAVWSLAFKQKRPAISDAEFQKYRAALSKYGHQPLALRRRIRYGIGQWLFGRGPFAPYLDRDNWETECRKAVPA